MIEIIAELAQGFEGRPEQAHLLMKAAAAAGADAVKYQLVYADELATPDYIHYDLFRSLEMQDESWESLAAAADKFDIRLYLDIFGERGLRLSERLGISAVKLHGTDIANVGFLNQVARSSISRILLGAGGACAGEIENAIDILSGKEVVVLLGFQGYPTPNHANQIARVRLLSDSLEKGPAKVVVGFADHAPPESPLCHALAATAIGAGAKVIEKHLTLGKILKLEDHESALNPDEFADFCHNVHHCTEAFGRAEKVDDFAMSDAEKDYARMIRRHVVVNRDMAAGTQLTPSDLTLKRTASGEVIMDLEMAYGKTLRRSKKVDTALTQDDID
jgi:N,N'-diacetyllegionaminate synthase